jgi:single-stranded-DNA-specific exonuclease
MKFRWSLAQAQPLLAGQLAKELRLPPLLAQCLLNRGLNQPAAIGDFLQPRLRQLADPFLLPNMAAAVERLLEAHARRERLVIFGDYDVDGVTSTALLFQTLSALGWSLNCYLPHRLDEGYGLSQEAVENCLKKFPATLLLAVDCGSTTVGSIAWLRARGVDVIVLDHHQVSDPPPAANALVNPQLNRKTSTAPDPDKAAGSGLQGNHQDTAPPFAELCSAGLAFKLAHALVKRGRETGLPGAAEFDLRPLLDLVALGTIADVVPLRGENRILVSAGLERLNATQRPGLVALKQVARCPGLLGAYEVGFQLAPRLNAAGRLETAEAALRLVLAQDLAQALPLAQNLDAQNQERQRLERDIVAEAIGQVEAKFKPENDFVIVEGQGQWHLGVVGIVAARLLQRFYRPTIIVGGNGDEWRGSGRSIAGFDLAAALRECSPLLVRHGGHALAAGLTVQPGNIDALRARLNQLAHRTLRAEELQPPLRLDAEVGLEEMTLECLAQLSQLKPMGQGNPPLQFFARNLTQRRPCLRMGSEKQHIKMWVTDGAITHEAVWWGAGSDPLPLGPFDLAFAPQVNAYNGQRTVQLKLLDWRAAQ